MAPPSTMIAPAAVFLFAAPVNSGAPADPVTEPVAAGIVMFAPYPDMLTMLAFVSLPAEQIGTTTAERVTMTSAGVADGQPGVTVIVAVTESDMDCLVGLTMVLVVQIAFE